MEGYGVNVILRCVVFGPPIRSIAFNPLPVTAIICKCSEPGSLAVMRPNMGAGFDTWLRLA